MAAGWTWPTGGSLLVPIRKHCTGMPYPWSRPRMWPPMCWAPVCRHRNQHVPLPSLTSCYAPSCSLAPAKQSPCCSSYCLRPFALAISPAWSILPSRSLSGSVPHLLFFAPLSNLVRPSLIVLSNLQPTSRPAFPISLPCFLFSP